MPRCLVIDDSPVIRGVYKAILVGKSYDFAEADNAADAAGLLGEAETQIVIVDWHMPDFDAHEFLTAVRARRDIRQPYIFYCTTENDPVDISQAMTAGADDYIIKPFDKAAVIEKLELIESLVAMQPLEMHAPRKIA